MEIILHVFSLRIFPTFIQKIDGEELYHSPEIEENNDKKLESIEKEMEKGIIEREKREMEETIVDKLMITLKNSENDSIWSTFHWGVSIEKLSFIFKNSDKTDLKKIIEKNILAILKSESKTRESVLKKWAKEGECEFISENIPKHLKFLDGLLLIDFKDKNINELIKIEQYELNNLMKICNDNINKKKKGCYIATSIYESYDCPEVWTLRRFRDIYLSKTSYGVVFIKIYYSVSPIIVKWFGEMKLFRKIFKKLLDKFVGNLQNKGFKSTPYKDK